MALLFKIFVFILPATLLARNPSPCPDVFTYDTSFAARDRWYGTINLHVQEELRGVWLQITLDRRAQFIGNWFGDSMSPDNKEFTITNLQHHLVPGMPFSMRFFVAYRETDIVPSLVEIRLNGKSVCSKSKIVTTTEKQLFISQYRPPKPMIKIETKHKPVTDKKSTVLTNVTVGWTDCEEVTTNRGGQSNQADWPWHGALYLHRRFKLQLRCGVTLISLRHVITTANCIIELGTSDPELLSVQLGKSSLLQHGPNVQEIAVSGIAIHPQNNDNHRYHNLAILHLKQTVKVTPFVKPVCLWQNNYADELQGKFVGWSTDEHGHVKSLSDAPVSFVPYGDCLNNLGAAYHRYLNEDSYCAGNTNGNTPCDGKIGGGMVFARTEKGTRKTTWHLRGIVSVSIKIQRNNVLVCDASKYLIFVDLKDNLPWINSILEPGKTCGVVPVKDHKLETYDESKVAGEWPWNAALYSVKDVELHFFCGGTLISERHVITSAHCILSQGFPVNPKLLRVQLGKQDLSDSGSPVQDIQVSKVTLYSDRNITRDRDNLAILHLKEYVKITNYVRPICLWSRSSDLNDLITHWQPGSVIGFGFEEGQKVPEKLKERIVPIVFLSTCPSHQKFYCAGRTQGNTVCYGDNGSGMVFGFEQTEGNFNKIWQLRGVLIEPVVSTTFCEKAQHMIFIDAAKYSDWIMSVVNDPTDGVETRTLQSTLPITTYSTTTVRPNGAASLNLQSQNYHTTSKILPTTTTRSVGTQNSLHLPPQTPQRVTQRDPQNYPTTTYRSSADGLVNTLNVQAQQIAQSIMQTYGSSTTRPVVMVNNNNNLQSQRFVQETDANRFSTPNLIFSIQTSRVAKSADPQTNGFTPAGTTERVHTSKGTTSKPGRELNAKNTTEMQYTAQQNRSFKSNPRGDITYYFVPNH